MRMAAPPSTRDLAEEPDRRGGGTSERARLAPQTMNPTWSVLARSPAQGGEAAPGRPDYFGGAHGQAGAQRPSRGRKSKSVPSGSSSRADAVATAAPALPAVVQRQVAEPVIQRQAAREHPFFFSRVAMALNEGLYEGRCNARFDHVTLHYEWSWGLLANDTSITFECGPVSFEFKTSSPHFDTRFPWGIVLVDGGSAWVIDDVERSLDVIDDHWDDEGGGFWNAVAAIKTALRLDVEQYCR